MVEDRKIKITAAAALFFIAMIVILLSSILLLGQILSSNTDNKKILWQVAFKNISEPVLRGNATVTSEPELSTLGTALSFELEFKENEDAVLYSFDVKNLGKIDAVISDISFVGISNMYKESIRYTLTYSDGTTVKKGDSLFSGASRRLKLAITLYLEEERNVLAEDINLNLGLVIIYTQK